jgi:hypothetical protein
MMKKIAVFLFLGILISCKSKQAAVATAVNSELVGITTDKIIENHYNNKTNFSTVYLKANARFANEKQTQNLTSEIRIKKDEQILISIRFLGITMAKALITPASVSYYEKLNGSYFEGDFSGLSQWLGTDLNYTKVQNMLLGEAFDDLKQSNYIQSMEEQNYLLEDLKSGNTMKTFLLDSAQFLIQKQEIVQPELNRKIQVVYSNITPYKEGFIPNSIAIKASQPKGETEINLNYTTITFNEQLSFPYSIPEGYKRIIIK